MTRSTRQRRIISILQITQPGEGTKGEGEGEGNFASLVHRTVWTGHNSGR